MDFEETMYYNLRKKVDKEVEEYVENLCGSIRPRIKNGRLVNLKDFKNNREEER